MSKVQLNSITINQSIPVPDYYVASILNSDSGFLTPRMVTSTADIDSYFGEFQYKQMYKKFINAGVPVLLSPIITPVSEYNRCSLRLNKIGSSVDHCHPRYGTDYQHVSYGEVINQSFTNETEVVVYTNSYIPLPYQILTYQEKENKVVELEVTNALARYEKVDGMYVIHFQFSHPSSGFILVERLPFIDNDPDSSGSIKLVEGLNKITIPAQRIPELVVLDGEGYCMEYSATYEQSSSTLEMDCSDAGTLYYRIVPNSISSAQTTVWDIVLSHNLGYYPILRTVLNEGSKVELVDVSIVHQSTDSILLQMTPKNSITMIFNIINVNSKVNVSKVELGEEIFNVILDFSSITEEEYTKIAGPNLPPLYFILLINGTKYLFIRYASGYTEQVPTDYYDERVAIREEDTPTLKDYILKVHEAIEEIVGPTNIKTFRSECIESVRTATLQHEELFPEVDESGDYNDIAFNEWYDAVKQSIYAKELFLGNYRVLINYLDSRLITDGNYNGLTISDLLAGMETAEELEVPKILVNYTMKSEELNHFYFPSLKITSSFNHNQDTLCGLSDKEKVIEFYALMKGSAGADITVTITDDKRHANYYYIDIQSSDRLAESYYCYIGDNYLHLDAVDIRSINQRSQLVEVVIYDYKLPDGRLVDQATYPFEDYDPSRVFEVKLPNGTYRLARNSDENWIYEDYRNTLKHLGETSYYPDFFLCPDPIRYDTSNDGNNHLREQISDIKSYIKGSGKINDSGLLEEGRYSQAFISLDWMDFENHQINDYDSEDNRVLFTYSNAIEKGNLIPIMYYYAINILANRPIAIPTDRLIYDIDTLKPGNAVLYNDAIHLMVNEEGAQCQLLSPSDDPNLPLPWYDKSKVTSITKMLEDENVNYLQYNNLYYYYYGFMEEISQVSTFYIQYHASKIAREFYKIKSKLTATTPSERMNTINNTVTKLLVLLNHLKNLDADPTINGREMQLNITARMKSLVNKTYDFNYILNIS